MAVVEDAVAAVAVVEDVVVMAVAVVEDVVAVTAAAAAVVEEDTEKHQPDLAMRAEEEVEAEVAVDITTTTDGKVREF